MKKLQHLCATAILTFVLAGPAVAGEMGFPVEPPTPPVPHQVVIDPNLTGGPTPDVENWTFNAAADVWLSIFKNTLGLL